MKLESITKADAKKIKENLAPQLINHPHFMFYCPEKEKRKKFIDRFLNYYLYNWSKFGELYISESRSAMATLVNTRAFEYKFSGKNAMKIRLDSNSGNILMHRRIVENITSIIVPETMETRVMTLYGSIDNNSEEVYELVREIAAHAKERGFALVYETFSKRLIDFMAEEGFEMSYQKQFLTTQYLQTLMTYNV